MERACKVHLVWLVSVALLVGCDVHDNALQGKRDKRLSDSELLVIQNANANQFLFGFDLHSSPQEDARQAMLDFQPDGQDAARLHNWHKTEMPHGFVVAQNNDYASLREWLLRFGLIKEEPDLYMQGEQQ